MPSRKSQPRPDVAVHQSQEVFPMNAIGGWWVEVEARTYDLVVSEQAFEAARADAAANGYQPTVGDYGFPYQGGLGFRRSIWFHRKRRAET